METPLVSSLDPINFSICCPCAICKKKYFFMTQNPKIKTTRFVVLILNSLKVLKPGIEYYSLTKDVLPFINDHMSLFANLKIFKTGKWRKSILDALNHSPEVESGRIACKNRGFYRLKNETQEINETTDVLPMKDELLFNLNLLYHQITYSSELLLRLNKFTNPSLIANTLLSEEVPIIYQSHLSSLQTLNDLKNHFCK